MQIQIGKNATAVEQKAASELKGHLNLLNIAGIQNMEFYIGAEIAKAAGIKEQELDKLGDEGFIIKRLGNKVILSGGAGAKRGTLYAVYEFLEWIAGWRWWTSEAETIPANVIRIPEKLDKRYIPAFEYRETLYRHLDEIKWLVRNRINGKCMTHGIPAEWGGYCKYDPFVHTIIGTLIPYERVRSHPEWWAYAVSYTHLTLPTIYSV